MRQICRCKVTNKSFQWWYILNFHEKLIIEERELWSLEWNITLTLKCKNILIKNTFIPVWIKSYQSCLLDVSNVQEMITFYIKFHIPLSIHDKLKSISIITGVALIYLSSNRNVISPNLTFHFSSRDRKYFSDSKFKTLMNLETIYSFLIGQSSQILSSHWQKKATETKVWKFC